jgi:hypothetical protein
MELSYFQNRERGNIFFLSRKVSCALVKLYFYIKQTHFLVSAPSYHPWVFSSPKDSLVVQGTIPNTTTTACHLLHASSFLSQDDLRMHSYDVTMTWDCSCWLLLGGKREETHLHHSTSHPSKPRPNHQCFLSTDMLSNSFASQHSALHFTSTVTYPSLTEELGGGDSPPSWKISKYPRTI